MVSDLETITSHLDKIMQAWEDMGYPVAINPREEFSRGGILCMFYSSYEKFDSGDQINLKVLTKEVVFNNTVGNIINELSTKASDAYVQQLDGANAQIKLRKNNKSYGYMFGLME